MTDEQTPPTEDELMARFASACLKVHGVTRSEEADTGSYTYRYTTLRAIVQAVKDACSEVGLVLAQPIRTEDGLMMVDTMLMDEESGRFIVFPGMGMPVKNDPQANGSQITYMRRYNLSSLFCIDQQDDDGAMAHRAAERPTERTPAEAEIRQIVASLPDAMAREDFIHSFKEQFGSPLIDLPESVHGDALTWAKAWNNARQEATA